MKYCYLIALFFVFFSSNATQEIPDVFPGKFLFANGKVADAFCSINKSVPEEMRLETERERIIRILLKYDKQLLAMLGLPVAQGIYSYTEHRITEQIKNKSDKTEERRKLSENFFNACAHNARVSLSVAGLYAIIGIIYDYRYEKPRPVPNEEKETKNPSINKK